MTIPQLMAFAAVLDSQGQAVEMSATAMSKLIMDLFKETDKIAKATGLDLAEFQETLNRSTNEGLLMLLDRLKQLGGMDVLAPVFKDMGEEGARASAVISALAGNVDTVRRQQVEANKAFNEATSVTKEFNVQNTTVQAGLDKARKRLTELAVELGEKLAPVMKHVISSTTLLLKVMSSIIDFVAKYKGEIVVVTASIVAYTIAVNAAAIKTKLLAVAQGVAKAATVAWTVVTQAAAVVTALFTGKLHKAKIEFMLFSAMLKASPIGLLVAGITAVVGGLALWIYRTKELTIAQKQLNDIENKAKQDTAEELSMLKVLYEASQDQKRSIEERTNAIAQLQEKYPDYFGSLSTEAILAGNAASEYDRLTTSILNSARAKARQEQMVANEQEIFKLEQERDNKVNTALDDMKLNSQDSKFYLPTRENKLMLLDWMSLEGKPEYLITKQYIDQVRENYNGKINQYRSANDVLSKQIADDIVKVDKSGSNTTAKCPKCGKLPCVCFKGGNGGGNGDNSPENSDRFKAENEWKEREEALNRIAYAKGEKSYEEYNKRINEIAVEYYKKLKGHKEATALEQVQFEAQYYEALKKQADDNTQLTLDKERESYNERLAEAKQFFIDGQYSLETYNEAIARIEEEHLRNMVTLTKEGTKERMDAEKVLADFQYNMAVKKQQDLKKQQDAIQKSQEKLKKDYFGDNAVERKNAYESDLANLQIVYEAELKATEGNAQEKLRIEEAYEKAKLALKKKYGFLAEEDNRNALERMNADFAEWLESDGGKAVMQSFDTVMSGMGAIFSQVSSLVQAELEIQTAAINKRYDKEISLAEGNTYKVAQLEKQKEKEIAKAKNEANKKMFAMQVIQAVAQTATNAINAYGSAAAIPVVGFVMAPIAAAMAVAAGALQIAAIKKQQQASEAQGYAKGGFTPAGAVDEEVGVVHAGEWVASQKLLANPVARPLINALDYAQRTNTIGSLRSADVSRSLANQSVVAQSAPTIVVEQNTEYTSIMKKLAERLDEPFVTVNTITGDNGIKKAQDEYDKLMRNKTPKSKRK